MFSIITLLTILVSNLECESDIGTGTIDNTGIYLEKVNGELFYACPNGECEYYFHVPIAYGSQVPVALSVEAPDLIDYRFLKMERGNVLCVARMNEGVGYINWESYLIVENNLWEDLPSYVPMPDPSALPDSVTPWLISTDCSQLESPYVIDALQEVGPGIDNLIELADSIAAFCLDIPWGIPHDPWAFDAHYTLRWANTCTGHAHVASALFRGNGIPSRALLNVPTCLGSGECDQHWFVDFYLPDYGWVTLESTFGVCPVQPHEFMVTFVNEPYHEFTKWYRHSIDALWHSSDPHVSCPNWDQAHSGNVVSWTVYSSEDVSAAMSLASELWQRHTDCTGLILTQDQADLRAMGEQYMQAAFVSIENLDIEGYIANAQSAIDYYESINQEEMEVIYEEDFESGTAGWTHGGIYDQWELGMPLAGPDAAYSGANCWATNLDGNYANQANNWLMSPVIDMDNRSCAELSFWLWNDVEDEDWTEQDTLFVQITCDGGTTFIPVSEGICGINDDPLIPAKGGWSKIVLDLRRHIGNQVQISFAFRSDEQNTFCGSYIDDVEIRGRYQDLTGISINNGSSDSRSSLICRPNPCSGSASIDVYLSSAGNASIAVYDAAGRRIAVPHQGWMPSGSNSLSWDCTNESGHTVPAGMYLIQVHVGSEYLCEKILVLR